MATLKTGTYPAYYNNYLKFVEAESIEEAIRKYSLEVVQFFEKVPENKVDFRYAEGKWSIKEMLQHIIDTERIFAYRALCLARGEQASLPGFDENDYARNSFADRRNWPELLEEFKIVRTSTDILFKSFEEEILDNSGITNAQPNTVRGIAFVTFGHILHHINIVKERYLVL